MENTELGVNEIAAAEQSESVTTETESVSNTEVTTEETTSAVDNSDGEQSAEENAKFAAVRRQAEAEAKAKYEQQIKKQNDLVKGMFGKFKNADTGKPIETVEDYIAAMEVQQRRQQEKELIEKGVNPKLIEEMIENSPAMREAKAVLEKSKQEEAQRAIDADLKAITAMDSDIKSFADLENSENFQTILGYVKQNGLSLVDAYKLANSDKLLNKQTAAAKQAAINSAKSMSHLETTKGVSQPSKDFVPIPHAVLERWQEAYPSLTMEQLTQKYNSVM